MNWYGLSPTGEKRMVTGRAMAEYAFEHDMQYQIGWTNHATINNSRYVRGKDVKAMIDTAIMNGWEDLAEMLFIEFEQQREEAEKPV